MKKQRKETTLLDSSLNTGHVFDCVPTIIPYKNYNIKVIDMQDYKQIYIYSYVKSHKIDGLEKVNDIDIDNLISLDNYKTKTDTIKEDKIDFKNVMRSKLKLQRIAKANESDWRTFITLTFKEDITDLNVAYNKFRYFIRMIQRYKNDFKWLCVPEFQKNGRVHYHLVSNIELGDPNLIYTQTLEDGSLAYHLKHWSKGLDENNLPLGKGYDCIETIKDKEGNDTKKLCGYISKYMSKAYIEDCFFNRNRYYLSQNLKLPITNYIDKRNKIDIDYLNDILEKSDIIYSKEYKDCFDNDITFIEFKMKNN